MSGQKESSGTRQVSGVDSGIDLQLSYASATISQLLAWRWLWRRLLGKSATRQPAEHDGEDGEGARP
jgi:hypothetical protein